MIEYSIVQTEEELEGISQLLQDNLGSKLSVEEKSTEGFLTVVYTLDDLKRMHATEASIIAKDKGKVIAYVLAMTASFKTGFPILEPLFDLFGKIEYKGKMISEYNYMVVGQTCIDKKYRGKGIFQKLYSAYINRFHLKYDFAITEIATKNLRSRRAHEKIGFQTVHEYVAPDGVGWTIVLLQW